MILDFKTGGISYNCEIDVDDGYVVGVFSVKVFDGEDYLPIGMTDSELEDFYEKYVDDLNEAYESHQIVMAEIAYEDRAELAMDR